MVKHALNAGLFANVKYNRSSGLESKNVSKYTKFYKHENT
jgi:hypothetical protein